MLAIFSAMSAENYIHQQSGWPVFGWDDRALMPMLADVRHRQGRLFGRMMALGFSLRDEAALETLTTEVVTSSAIEGERLNSDQVRSSIARRLGLDVGGALPTDRDVEGIVEMMIDATQRFATPLTDERLFGWHAALFPTGRSGMARITVGAWRTPESGPMQVVSGRHGREPVHFEAPAAERLATEMAGFLDWLSADQGIDPVLKAGIAHLWFVTIHPFEDGNGRIARAVAELALARSEHTAQRFYSMSAQIRSERDDYYRVLEHTQSGGLDITLWLDWFLGCLGRAVDRAETALAPIVLKAQFWERHATKAFNERQRTMLTRLVDGFDGKLTSSKWAKLTKTSQDTASRDIADLIDKGILVKDAAGGRSSSYSLVVVQHA